MTWCGCTIPGTGPTRIYSTLYTDTPTIVRVAARGATNAAIFYYGDNVGNPPSLTASGGGSLGSAAEPYFQGVVQNDRFYFTDRAGALRVFQVAPASGNQVRPVALPVAPVTAPPIFPRTYRMLETWPGVAGVGGVPRTSFTNWTEDNASFALQDITAVTPPPGGGRAVRLHIITSAGIGGTIFRDFLSAPQDLSSHTIAFWARLSQGKISTQYGIGLGAQADYNIPIITPGGDTWYPLFFPIADLPNLRHEAFKCLDSFTGDGPGISSLYLPGRLEGQYLWRYTYYDSVGLRESGMSPVSGNGTPADFSAVGVNNQTGTARAFQKSAAMQFTPSGDATINRVRFYRNGGTPELTTDSRGLPVWLQVGEIAHFSTTLTAPTLVGDTSFTVASNTGFNSTDSFFLVLEPGTATEEYVRAIGLGGPIVVDQPMQYAHANNGVVRVAFLDNVANETIDVSQTIDVERNDPPAAAKFVARSPEGRLWLFNYSGFPTGVAVSNRATPLRPTDYEVFPDNVDPLTRRSLTQGWRFQIGGDQNDEEIVWGGFFRDQATILTRHNIYVITAHSQLDWGPLAVRKMRSVGCIAKDTVQEVNGVLYWVADGPRVMRWDGIGDPEDISHLRINVRLLNTDPTSLVNWFSEKHTLQDGTYYQLYIQPPGGSGITNRLDWNVPKEAWEPVTYYSTPFGQVSPATPYVWNASHIQDVQSDINIHIQIDNAGNVYTMEVGNLDNVSPIICLWQTKRFPVDFILLAHQVFVRMQGVTDTLNLTVITGGSEYGTVTHTYPINLTAVGELELKQRLDRDLLGRWVQIQGQWAAQNRPAVRDLAVWYLVQRVQRHT